MAEVDGLPDEDFEALNAEAPDDNESLAGSDAPSYVSDEEFLNDDVRSPTSAHAYRSR
jgi:hypothetical protein